MALLHGLRDVRIAARQVRWQSNKAGSRHSSRPWLRSCGKSEWTLARHTLFNYVVRNSIARLNPLAEKYILTYDRKNSLAFGGRCLGLARRQLREGLVDGASRCRDPQRNI